MRMLPKPRQWSSLNWVQLPEVMSPPCQSACSQHPPVATRAVKEQTSIVLQVVAPVKASCCCSFFSPAGRPRSWCCQGPTYCFQNLSPFSCSHGRHHSLCAFWAQPLACPTGVLVTRNTMTLAYAMTQVTLWPHTSRTCFIHLTTRSAARAASKASCVSSMPPLRCRRKASLTFSLHFRASAGTPNEWHSRRSCRYKLRPACMLVHAVEVTANVRACCFTRQSRHAWRG